MFEWFNRVSIKQSFVLVLRRFKTLDAIIGEIYDNLEELADAINNVTGDSTSVTLEFNSSTQYIDLTTEGKDVGYDSQTGYITFRNTTSSAGSNAEQNSGE